MNKSERAQVLADDWVTWLDDHRFFGPQPKKSIIAQLIEKNRARKEPPDRPLNAEIAAFHVAVMGLSVDQFRYFVRVYCGVPFEPIKTLAFDAGIGRDTYYERAHSAAHQVLRSMDGLLAMVENMGIRTCRSESLQNRSRHMEDVLIAFAES